MVRLFGAVTTFVCAFGLASGAVANDKIERVEMVAVQPASTDIVEAGVERVMSQLPQMTYKVGEVETKCGYSAASEAKSSGNSMSYLVAGSSYNCKVTAMNKLAEAMKAELASAANVTPSVAGSCYHCPMAAAAMAKQKNTEVKYMVAGIEFDCADKARAVSDKLAAKMKDCGAATASATPCSKTAGSSPCSKSAKVASAKADGKGCCKTGCAKAASGGAPCAKSAEAAVASAKGGCSKSKDAQTASVKSSGCSKAKAAATAQAASTKGCCKDKAKAAAVVAAAESTEPTTLKLGCCKKKAGEDTKAKVAAQVASTETETASEDTPELARAKQMVREIVEFVAAAKNS